MVMASGMMLSGGESGMSELWGFAGDVGPVAPGRVF